MPSNGAFIPFVDPALPAPQAPVHWSNSAAAPLLDALTGRPHHGAPADLSIARLTSARHVVIGPAGEESVILRDADKALTLRFHGSRASRAPVTTTFQLPGIPEPSTVAAALASLADLVLRPNHNPHQDRHPLLVRQARDPLLLREALVALDGRRIGASYRDMAAVIFGAEDARAAWSSKSRWMKDRMHRALAKGEQLRDGGYRMLLQ